MPVPRDERHLQPVQLVGDAIEGGGQEAGIGEDDLVDVARCGVSLAERLRVEQQGVVEARQPGDERVQHALPLLAGDHAGGRGAELAEDAVQRAVQQGVQAGVLLGDLAGPEGADRREVREEEAEGGAREALAALAQAERDVVGAPRRAEARDQRLGRRADQVFRAVHARLVGCGTAPGIRPAEWRVPA